MGPAAMLYYTPVHTTFSFPSPSRPLTSIAETFRSEFRLSRHMVCVRRTKLQRGSFQIYRAETNTAVCAPVKARALGLALLFFGYEKKS